MKRTKRRLFYSIVSLMLCFAMLMGTTYAWFTDSVTSVNNIIKTGELDLKVLWTDDLTSGIWKDAEKSEDGPVFAYENWEPGYTAIRYVKIVNDGSLAFKYALNIIPDGDAGMLGDVIDVYYVENASSGINSLNGLTKAGVLNDVISGKVNAGGVLLPKGETKTGFYTEEIVIAIALHMQETAGNEYQDKSVGASFAIQLMATQYDYESDDIGGGYDQDAQWPEFKNADVVLDVTTNNGVTTADVQKSENGIGVTLKQGTKVNGNKVGVTMETMAQTGSNLQLSDGEELIPLNVHADGVAEDNTVPLVLDLGEIMPKGLNMGNYSLYHVEDGNTVAMTLVSSVDELDVHNEFCYDPVTGGLVVAMATFSEVTLVANTENAWNGTVATGFADGDGSEGNPYLIANADQLAYFGEVISNENDTYGDKYYKLIADINLGGEENANNGIIFYPIGYHKVGADVATVECNDAPEFVYIDEIEDEGDEVLGTADYAAGKGGASTVADSGSTAWYTFGGAFKGVFDGNGNTIKNVYQNTWQMKGDYEGDKHYWNDAMGIFGYVYGGTIKNLTVDSFTSDGEFTPTGVIAAYAAGNSTFENIAITNCNPRVYNTGNGGIIGVAGSTTSADDDHITLKNITIDKSNKISALWGSWDVACGGLVGMYRGNVDGNGNATGDTISFENCHVSAIIDVYNDVCANYQYYAYRYSGMIIGSIRHNTKNAAGKTIPNMAGISATKCTVNYGDWNDYYYCEFEKNTEASYSEDYQFSRVPHSELNFTDSNGNGVVDADERDSVTGCKHTHTEEENHQAIYLPFHQLFTGYSWGVSSIGLEQYSGIVTDLGITEGDHEESVEKFEGKVDALVNHKTYTFGEIFTFVDNGVELVPGALTVGIVNKDVSNPVSATITYDSENWANGTITLTGTGTIQITIQDYYFCTPTTITVEITEHDHAYDNDCDAECNVCGATREVGAHVYDNACDVDCNTCGATREVGDHVYDNACDADCNECGATREVGDHVYDNACDADCNVCGTIREVGDHVYDDACDVDCNTCGAKREVGDHVYDNACDADCNVCGAERTPADHVYDNACDRDCNVCGADRTTTHTPADAVIENKVESTCTVAGHYDSVVYCSVCDKELGRETVALELIAHEYSEEVIKPTCTTGGYTTYTCACGHSYVGNEVDALRHTEVIDEAKAPTCTETGLTEGKHCSVCNTVFVAQETVAALQHTEVVDEAVAATCTTSGLTEGKHCSVCNEVLVAQTTINAGHTWVDANCTAPQTCSECNATEGEALGHTVKNFTNNKFTYRIGNKNDVKLNSLFGVGVNIVENKTVSSGTASVEITGDSLQFSGTGIITITLERDCTCDECIVELTLEVVDAVNATTATSATANNIVLLNDCGFSSLEVSGGYTLYGNGFTMTCGSDSAALDMGYSFVTLNDGTLDNVQIICPNFDYAVLYKSNMTESGNRSETTDKTRYFNVKSGVMVSGNSQILNSRISGGRAAVNVSGGNCVIDNSRIELGAVASLLVGSANSLTLRDVTLVQKPTASTYDSSKTLMGFSVLFVCDANGDAAPVTLEGTLIQNAWVDENDKQYVPSAGQSIINTVLGKIDYLHDLDGDGTKESLNLGFAYMPESLTSKVNTTTITDNRTNKDTVPYDYAEVSILNGKTYVYSYKNTNGTADSFKTEAEYKPNKQGDVITVTYNDTTNGLESGKSFGTAGWVYELNVDLDKASGYKLDFSKLAMVVNGVPVTDYKVNGSAKPASPVAVTAGGTTYTLTATVNGKEHSATYKVTGTETSKESPSKLSGPTSEGFGVAGSYGGDWSGAADVLTGVKIKYWSVAENKYVEFDFSNFTVPGNAGKLNGTNSYWEYTHTNNDFTLKVTNTVAIHSGKSVYGMPIRGTDGKLYFTISSTNGYVGSGTTSRAITMQYEFTDNNGGEKLTFTHTFNISYDKNNQYKYSDLCNGKMTKLEKSCVTSDTLVMLADGTQKRIDQITTDDMLLVWNFYTGEYDVVPSAIIFYHGEEEYDIVKLHFEDGTSVKVINNHGFYDVDLDEFIFLDETNADEYIGHKFVKVDGDGRTSVALIGYEFVKEYTGCYSIQTAVHINFMVEGMFSLTIPPFDGWFDYFEIGEGMKYDEEKMQADIEKYGLYTYEDFAEYVTYEQFIAFNGPYLKVLVGRGVVTYEQIMELISTYVNPEQ